VRKAGQNPGRGSELYVQPAELARKLVKEMEDHKVSRGSRVSVPNRYTVFLCVADADRMADRADLLVAKLERHLAKHVRAKRYDVPGEIDVALLVDEDLSIGYFGILAESDPAGAAEHGTPPSVGPGPRSRVRQTPPPPAVSSEPVEPLWTDPALSAGPRGGRTEIIPAEDVARLGLARQTLVLRAGNREREFTQGRVVVGRARDVDFRIDDTNVSRRHAAIFWSEGQVMIEDLGSTNGTMVNGYPVTTTVVRPGDVVVIGDCRITVETR